jgi:FkbM family methyltransferase
MGLNGLDRKLAKHLDWTGGTFVEAGGNDGLDQSNTYWFERFRGWRGILIEPQPWFYAKCRQNRPRAKVFNCALVANDTTTSIKVAPGGLRGYVVGGWSDPAHEVYHRSVAAKDMGVPDLVDVEVPARTLASVLEEANIGRIDLFSLDVEGYEMQVFEGMNVEKHRPRFLCVETRAPDAICAALNHRYETVEQLTESDFLFRAKD